GGIGHLKAALCAPPVPVAPPAPAPAPPVPVAAPPVPVAEPPAPVAEPPAPVDAPPVPACVPPEPPASGREVALVQAENEDRDSENKARLSEARLIQISSSNNAGRGRASTRDRACTPGARGGVYSVRWEMIGKWCLRS